MPTVNDEFIGDPLRPDAATFDADRMAAGEPGLPRRFLWRCETIEVQSVLRTWKETGSCSHGSDEQYVKKHWYELSTDHGMMKVYFERNARGGSKGTRWWLFSLRREKLAVPVPALTGETWLTELKRRSDEIDSGEAILTPWPDVKQRVRFDYGWKDADTWAIAVAMP